MCFYHGNFDWRRPINLKQGSELAGGYWLPDPLNKAFFFVRLILFITCFMLAVVDLATTDYNDDELFYGSMSQAVTLIYCVYMSLILFVSFLVLFTETFESFIISIIYHICLQLQQLVIATSITILIFGDGYSIIILIAFIFIWIEFFCFSLLQFNFIFGLVSPILFYFIYVSIFIESGSEKERATFFFVGIMILIHLIVTLIKRNENTHWFIRNDLNINIINNKLLNVDNLNQYLNENDNYATIHFCSCVDQTMPRIPSHQQMLQRSNPDVVVLAGDNVYADMSPPTLTKLRSKFPCFTKQTFKESYDQLLDHVDFKLAQEKKDQTVFLATWDDHDYGENDAGVEYKHKLESKHAFLDWFKVLNNDLEAEYTSAMENDERGIYYHYDYQKTLPDNSNLVIRFYLLDCRFHREEMKDMFGKEQWEWFENLINTGKNDNNIDWHILVCASPILNEGPKGKKTIEDSTRQRLMNIINNANLSKKTFILSGDIHYHCWHKCNDIFELTSSSVTHTKPWFFPQYLHYQSANKYKYSSTYKSECCQKEGFGQVKINKNEWKFCVKSAFGYSYIHVSNKN